LYFEVGQLNANRELPTEGRAANAERVLILMRIPTDARPNVFLHRFAVLLAGLTIFLLIAGALVTSNEAGDSVPDWPLSFGRWLIASEHFTANVRYEYSHRFIAGVVGVATLLLMVLAFLLERRAWLKKLAVAAFVGVVLQAVIGGIRVHFPEQKPVLAVIHALVAQSFFALVVAIAVFTSRSWVETRDAKPDDGNPPLRSLTAATVAAVLVQLVLGAGFRHGAFGIIPHIVGAAAVTILIVSTAIVVLRRHSPNSFLARPAALSLVFLIMQLALGVGAYVARLKSAGDPQPLEPVISLTAGHVVVGALTLASVLLLSLRCHRVLVPESEMVSTEGARAAA
jgi:cytochrome c oxidase assembly protein subunit 15